MSPGGNTGVSTGFKKRFSSTIRRSRKDPERFEGHASGGKSQPEVEIARLWIPDATGFVYTIAFEFQLIDDERHKDALKDAAHQTGALYSMIPAMRKHAIPLANGTRRVLKLKGQHFEHWINGTKVLEGSLKDPAVAAGAEKRWGKYAPMVRDMLSNPKPNGPVRAAASWRSGLVQEHQDQSTR